MDILRRLLAVLISVGLVISPVGAATNAMSHGSDMTAVAATMDPGADAADSEFAATDMADCQKSMAACDRSGCNAKSKCPDQTTCMTKCCKVLSTVGPAAVLIILPEMQYRLSEPAKPPAWVNAPPAPPPRS